MNLPFFLMDAAAPSVAALLVNSLWQGAALAGGTALAMRALRSLSPSTRTAAWMAVMVAILVLPLASVLMPHVATASRGVEVHVAARWSVCVVTLWAALTAYRAVRLCANGIRLWGISRRSVPVCATGRIQERLLGPRPAALCVSTEVNRPSVVGFFQPRVLLPAGLFERLSATELEHVVLHEMEHLRRRDDWWNLLQQVILVLLPLNPALLWLSRQLCQDRELACDDGVLATTQARKAYAACLVRLAEESLLRKGLTLALSALGTRARQSEFVGRVQRILMPPERTMALRQAWLLTPVLLVGVAGVAATVQSPPWIHFDAAPALSAREIAPALSSATPVPAWAAVTVHGVSGEARPVLASAVMNRPSDHRSVVLASARRRVRTRRAAAHLAVMGQGLQAPHRLPPQTEAAGRLMMTEFEVAQPVYAAVPWQDGWLIVQL